MEDETGARRVLSSIGSALIEKSVAKATGELNKTGFPTAKIQSELRKQSHFESECGGDWRIASRPSASAFGTIFEHSGNLAEMNQREAAPQSNADYSG